MGFGGLGLSVRVWGRLGFWFRAWGWGVWGLGFWGWGLGLVTVFAVIWHGRSAGQDIGRMPSHALRFERPSRAPFSAISVKPPIPFRGFFLELALSMRAQQGPPPSLGFRVSSLGFRDSGFRV